METPSPDISAAFVDDLLARMQALGARPYSEVGVPMFLVAEDLSYEASPKTTSEGRTYDLAALLTQMAEALATRRPELSQAEVARLLELLADRYLVAFAAPAFSVIGATARKPSRHR